MRRSAGTRLLGHARVWALAACVAACHGASEGAVLPVPRAGAELVGRDGLAALPARFVGARPELAGRVVLVRWWTDGCPFCERSLPALDAVVERQSARGLAAVGVYHPKPPRAVDDPGVIDAARRLGWHRAIAIDADWSALNALWLDGREREATSAAFLLDRRGRVRWVHPGPELHASDAPEHAQCARDLADLERAIDLLLAERP